MNSATIQPPDDPTERPEDIDADDFLSGYQMGRVASKEVIYSIRGRSTHSLLMGYIAYHALLTNQFPDLDHIKAAEFAERLGLGKQG